MESKHTDEDEFIAVGKHMRPVQTQPESANDAESNITEALPTQSIENEQTRLSIISVPAIEDEPSTLPDPDEEAARAAELALETIRPKDTETSVLQPAMPAMVEHEPMSGADGTHKRRWPLVLCAVIAALAVVYGIGVFYYSSHFFPNTTVNGEDVSNMTFSELSAYVTNLGATYKAHVTGEGLDFSVAGKDIDFVYDGAAYGTEAGDQVNPWNWPIEVGHPHAYTVGKGISFDGDKLNKIIEDEVNRFNENTKRPTNATMKYDENEEKFVVVPEKAGTRVSLRVVNELVSEGVSGMMTEVDVSGEGLVQPKVTSEDEKLNATIERANKLLGKKIPIRIADKDATEIDASKLKDWIGINKDLNISINRVLVKEWAEGPLSDEFDTVGNKRTYKRPDGKEIEIEGGTYGWILNGEELANQIADRLENNNTDAIDAPMKMSASKWNPDGKEWPNRYIDVDLSEQHARMYDDNSEVIWESDCVSGNTSTNHGTVLGAFTIQDKASPMKLVGLDENNDGFPDYESDVTFWMPFDGGYGLHDATWRYAFGGNIYTYDGSHGCVNLPYDAAQRLYEIANIGDVVVVHW